MADNRISTAVADKANGAEEKLSETLQDGYNTAKEKVEDGYHKVTQKAHEVWDKAADTTLHDAQHSVAHYVRRNPSKCLLMAAGAGLVLGIILRGRIG